jgi:hypothetical protein
MSAASTSPGLAAMAFPSSAPSYIAKWSAVASKRRHPMRSIAEQCHPRYAIPSGIDRGRSGWGEARGSVSLPVMSAVSWGSEPSNSARRRGPRQ